MNFRDSVMERRRIYYSGRVQGVGFRYSAVRAAGGYEVTGFVRNLPDGRVEVVVEGKCEQIGAFLGDLTDVMGGYIIDTRTVDEPYLGEFRMFEVRS